MTQTEQSPNRTRLSDRELYNQTEDFRERLKERFAFILPVGTEAEFVNLGITIRKGERVEGYISLESIDESQTYHILLEKNGLELQSVQITTRWDSYFMPSKQDKLEIDYKGKPSSRNTHFAASKAWEILDDLLPPRQSEGTEVTG